MSALDRVRYAKATLAEEYMREDLVTGIGIGVKDDGGYYIALNVSELPGPRGGELVLPREVDGFEVRVTVTGSVNPL